MEIGNKGNLFAGQCFRDTAIGDLIMMNLDGVGIIINFADDNYQQKKYDNDNDTQ